MEKSNVHPIFESLLAAVDPKRSKTSTESALDIAAKAIHDKGVLLSGFNKIASVLIGGYTSDPQGRLEEIRQITLDTLEMVGNK